MGKPDGHDDVRPLDKPTRLDGRDYWRRRRPLNRALAITLALLCVLLFLITIVKFGSKIPM